MWCIICCFVWGKWDVAPCLILNIFTIWTKWATTPNVCVIYPNSMIYLSVQFYALCPVLSGIILIFNTNFPIMPHITLQCLRTVTLNDMFWSNLPSITVFFSWYFMKISLKWSDEATIFSKLQVYESIHEGFSFSVTLKAGFCSMFSFKFFLCRRPVSLKLESYCV